MANIHNGAENILGMSEGMMKIGEGLQPQGSTDAFLVVNLISLKPKT